MATNSYFEAHKRGKAFLQVHGKDEDALLYLLLEQLHWTKTQWLLQMNEEIPQDVEELLKEDVRLLMKDMPPQYILGYTEFYGLNFHVTEDTLIPRVETEELVELILAKTRDVELTCVDIGTGSGAIAISLQKNRENWTVYATDISQKALQVARANGIELGAAVDFKETNILDDLSGPFDIIVSNPPYISKKEISEMDQSVLKYEPQSALFAENDGLYFYEEIAKAAEKKLAKGGKIFLEIGYEQKYAVENIFRQHFPKKKIQTFKDLSGHDRMVLVEDAFKKS